MDAQEFKFQTALPAFAKIPDLSVGYRLAAYYGKRFFYRYNPDWVSAYRNGLLLAFPEESKKTIDHWCEKHFSMISAGELNAACLSLMTEYNYKKWVSFDIPKNFLDKKEGKILVVGHFSNTNLLSALGLSGFPCNIFSSDLNSELSASHRRFLIQSMDNLILNIKGDWLTKSSGYREIYSLIKRGESIIIAVDVPAVSQRNTEKYPFLKGTLTVPTGSVRIAEKTGAQLYYVRFQADCFRTRVSILPLSKNPKEAMQQAFQYLEQDVLAAPWLWWQFNALPDFWNRS